jgi:hypothetical protein
VSLLLLLLGSDSVGCLLVRLLVVMGLGAVSRL